jgi:hypothetical protein
MFSKVHSNSVDADLNAAGIEAKLETRVVVAKAGDGGAVHYCSSEFLKQRPDSKRTYTIGFLEGE